MTRARTSGVSSVSSRSRVGIGVPCFEFFVASFFSLLSPDVAAALPSSWNALNRDALSSVTDHTGSSDIATLDLYQFNSVALTCSSDGWFHSHLFPYRHWLWPRLTDLPGFICPNASRMRPLHVRLGSLKSWHSPHGFLAASGIDPGTFGFVPSIGTHGREKKWSQQIMSAATVPSSVAVPP